MGAAPSPPLRSSPLALPGQRIFINNTSILPVLLTEMDNSQPARRGRPPIQDGQDVVNSQQVSVWVTRRPDPPTSQPPRS